MQSLASMNILWFILKWSISHLTLAVQLLLPGVSFIFFSRALYLPSLSHLWPVAPPCFSTAELASPFHPLLSGGRQLLSFCRSFLIENSAFSVCFNLARCSRLVDPVLSFLSSKCASSSTRSPFSSVIFQPNVCKDMEGKFSKTQF